MRAVLTYHSLDESSSVISLSPSAFRAHVEWMVSGAASVVSLRGLLALSELGDAHGVAITFDDGFVNFAEHAAPLLREHGIPSTLFVVADHVGRDNAWGGRVAENIPTMPLLDWDALGRLAEAGVEIGAHSRTHAHLTSVSDAALEDELSGCAEVIEQRLGVRPTAFAYPYGDVDARVVNATRQVFDIACTTEFRLFDDANGITDTAQIPRLDAWYFRDAQRLQSFGTAAFAARVALRHAARRARRWVSAD